MWVTALGPNAGSAHITVKPSLRNWKRNTERELEREMGGGIQLPLKPPDSRTTSRVGEKAGADFASGFDRMVRKRVQGALAALPKTQIGVASNEAEQRLKDLRGELDTLSKKRIGIDVDAQGALARLREIEAQLERLSAESVDINVKADTILASAQLAAIHREVNALERDDATVRVGVNGAPSASAALSGLGQSASMASLKLGAVAAAGIVLIPVLAQLVTLAATLATTLVAAGGGLGAVLAGLLGNILPVIKAQSELEQKQQEAASAAESYASAQNGVRNAAQAVAAAEVSASRAIGDAQRAVADARRNAARAIASAEEAVVAAQERRQDAQEDLTDAIEAARKKLADYQNQLRAAALDESGAALTVTQAQERLNEVLSDPTATQLQIDLARQSLKEAQLGYDEATRRRKDLREQAAKDRKAGVDGDSSVVAARDRLADANRALAGAERQLAQARADGARQVAQAQQQLADARVAEAAAAAKLADAQAEVQERLAKLSGPAAVFVKALDRAKSAWGDFVKATAGASFGLAARGLDLFSRLLPKFVPLARRSSKAVGVLLDDFARFATGKEGRGFIRWLTRTAPRAIVTVGRALGNIAIGLGGLLGALTDTDTGFLDLTRRFADFGRTAGSNSTVRAFFEYAKDNAPLVADLVRGLAGSFVQWMRIMGPVGSMLVRVLGLIFRAWAPFLKFMIDRTMAAARIVRRAFTAVVLPVLRAVWRFIDSTLIPIVQFLWRQVVRPIFGFIGDAAQTMWKRFIRPAFQAIDSVIRNVVGPVFRWLWEKVVKPVAGFITDRLTTFKNFIRDDVVPVVKRGIDRIGDIFDGLRKAAGTPVKFIVDTVYNNGLRKVINAIPGVDDVDAVDTSGWPSFARGGVLPGWTPGRDVHRFVSPTAGVLNLSGGEAVMRPEWTRMVGGPAAVKRMNDAARRGDRRRGLGFFLGGVLPLIGASYTSHGSAYPFPAYDLNYPGYADYGKPIRAWKSGVARPFDYGRDYSYGRGQVIEHAGGQTTLYAHMSRVITSLAGKAVRAGQVIGYVGDYGNTGTPPTSHLHFEIRGGSVPALPNSSSSGGGSSWNPLAKFGNAISAVKSLSSLIPNALDKLRDMGPWGSLLMTGLKSIGGGFRSWVNGKIPGPGPLGNIFDSGGLAFGRGYLAKRTLQPERVLSPAQTAAFERQVATLDHWDRTARALATAGGGAAAPAPTIAKLRIVDWDKGLAELEYMATSAAEQVYLTRTAHAARIDDLSADY